MTKILKIVAPSEKKRYIEKSSREKKFCNFSCKYIASEIYLLYNIGEIQSPFESNLS